MAWETRGGKRYFYEKKRVNGRVVSVYRGSDVAGQLAELEGQQKDGQRRKQKEERAAFRQMERKIDDLCDEITLIRNALLIATGHHRHKGQWRKKRE